jgi:outer membrane receptor protein involved in Fe transport
MEMGFRTSLRKQDSRNDFYIDTANGVLNYAADRSVLYNSRDQVHALYATYSRQLKTFNYQLGLRAESSTYEGNLPNRKQSFNIDFPLSLFPSVFLSQKLGEDQDMQLNYSRRINRPNFWQLAPFTDYTDTLSITRGNPALRPEFTNAIELSYSKIFKNRDNFLASVYFRNTNDLISRIQTIENDSVVKQSILVNTYINANRSYITGLELTTRNNLTKWYDVNANLNLFVSQIQIDVPGQTQLDPLFSYFAKINNTFKLQKSLSLQVSADYQSRTILPAGGGGGGRGGGFGGGFGQQSSAQGYIKPNYGVDAAMRFEFGKNRAASISLNIQDIFRTRRYQAISESDIFYQEISRRRDPRIMRLNFNWRFGKFDPTLFKRKNTRGEREGNNVEGIGL